MKNREPGRFTPRWQQRGKSLMPRIQSSLLINQAMEVLHLHESRRRANIEARRMREYIESGTVSGKLQSAALGTEADAEAFGLFDPSNGPFLGFFYDRPIFYPQNTHLATLAPTGGGKGVTQVIPNIVLGGGNTSYVILDLKDGELSWCTAEARAALDGHDPVFANPFGVHGWPNTPFNPFQDAIDGAAGGRKIVDLAAAKVRMLIGDTERRAQNAWIYEDAGKMTWMLLVENAHHQPEHCNPAWMWDFANGTFEDFVAYCEVAQHSPAADGFVATIARALLDRYGDEKTDQLGWVMDAMAQTFSLYGRGSHLRASVQETGFDLAKLKQRPCALYLMIPDMFAKSHGKHVSLLLDYIFGAVARASGSVPVTVLADEFSNFPRIDSITTVLRLYREKGVRLWTFVQDRAGYAAYKEEGAHKPFEDNSVQIIWGLSDAAHSKDIEALAGYNAVAVTGFNTSAGVTAPGAGQSLSEQVTPVLPVSDIAQIGPGRALLLINGYKIFVIERRAWWDIDFVKPYVRDKFKDPPPPFVPG